jgi:hypothetical protein
MKKTNITKAVDTLTTQASNLAITTPEALTEATSILSTLNTQKDNIEALKAKVLDPLNAARKAEIARWKPALDKLESAIASIRSQMSQYATQQANTLKAQEEAIAARIAPGRGNYTLDTAVKKLDELEKTPDIVETAQGSVTFRPIQRLKITNRNLIPDEYWIVDETAILADLKAGLKVAGAELETIQVPVNKR